MKLPRLTARRAEPDALDWIDVDDRSVADRLAKYADSLSPDEVVMTRMRASVRAAFAESATARRTTVTGNADAGADAQTDAPRWGWLQSRNRRLGFAAVCVVATLTLSTVGVVAAESGPGQPFYRLRLGIESVNLPQVGSQDRLDADLDRADARLADIANEAAASDWSATADAANAYRDVIAAIVLPADMSVKGPAVARLNVQLTRLEQLRAESHGPATPALDLAIEALCKVLGIAAPTPWPVATAAPTAATTRGGAPAATAPETTAPEATATAAATATDPDRNRHRSIEPGASPSPGSTATSGDLDGHQPGGGTGDHASPTPTTSAPDGDRSPSARSTTGRWIAGQANSW